MTLLLLAVLAAAPACDATKSQIEIASATALRRGPGLNYGVSHFIERKLCARIDEVSVDGVWVLIERGSLYGWIPATRVATRDRPVLEALRPEVGPVGGGDSRRFLALKRSTALRSKATKKSKLLKRLAKGARLLLLARKGSWVLVRDRRGEEGWVRSKRVTTDGKVLDALPVPSARDAAAQAESDTVAAPKTSPKPKEVERPAARMISVRLGGGGYFPTFSLDSNAVQGFRRYELSALTAGGDLLVETPYLDPWIARLRYAFAPLGGISPEGDPREVAGMAHSFSFAVGYRLHVAGVQIEPELGYSFRLVDLDADLPGEARGGTLISTADHSASMGLVVRVPLVEALSAEFGLAAIVGATMETVPGIPGGLGAGGLALGAEARAGLAYAFVEHWGVGVQYDFHYRTASYDGATAFDPTITTATLQTLAHAVGLFVQFAY